MLELVKCVTGDTDSARAAFGDAQPMLLVAAGALRQAVENLMKAMPGDIEMGEHQDLLYRHLHFIDVYLNKEEPAHCLKDPVDILNYDLPGIVDAFDRCYKRTASPHPQFDKQLRRHIEAGDMNAAVREGFAVWKTRIVERWDLPEDLDGHQLARELFGNDGPTAGLFSDQHRLAYEKLYTSLFTLLRNPPSHGVVDLDRPLVEGGLTLLSWLLAAVEKEPQQ